MFRNNKKIEEYKRLSPAAHSRLSLAPKDMQMSIIAYLNHAELGVASQLSHGLNAVATNQVIWKRLYTRQFGATPFQFDLRQQYDIQLAYHTAQTCMRPDQATYLWAQAFKKVLPYQQEPWAWYFIGNLYFYGNGVKENIAQGIYFLKQAFYLGDFRAARELVSILIARDEVTLAKINSVLTEKDKENIFLFLKKESKKKQNNSLLRALSCLYQEGIGTTRDLAKAEACLELSFEQDPQDKRVLKDLVSLYLRHQNIPQAVDIQKAVDFLEKMYEKYRYPWIASELGSFYQNYKEDLQTATQWFQLAFHGGEAQAAIAMGLIFLSSVYPDRTQRWLQRAYQGGARIAAEMLAEWMFAAHHQPGLTNEAIIWAKRAYLEAGSTSSATKLSDHYRQRNDFFFQNPNQVWWIQIAAMAGDQDALYEIGEAALEGELYASCALQLIRAVKNFSGEMEVVPDLLVQEAVFLKYIEAGKEEGLWGSHFENMMFPPKNNAALEEKHASLIELR